MLKAERYGGRRAFAEHLLSRCKAAVGAYASSTEIDWRTARRLVFVCKGNICRSPYAAARARELGLQAISFGLEADDGTTADPLAVRNALARNLDLSSHRSARLVASGLRQGDVVLLFEPRHLTICRGVCGNVPEGISLLGLWTQPMRPYISDPFGKSDRYFQECFSIIDSALSMIAGKISA